MFKIKRLTDDLSLISDQSIPDDAQEHPVYVLFGDEEYTLLFDSLFNKASYYEKLKRIVIVHRDSPLMLSTVLHPNTGEARDDFGHPVHCGQGASIPAEVKLRAIQR
jgi:hypothetical protein